MMAGSASESLPAWGRIEAVHSDMRARTPDRQRA